MQMDIAAAGSRLCCLVLIRYDIPDETPSCMDSRDKVTSPSTAPNRPNNQGSRPSVTSLEVYHHKTCALPVLTAFCLVQKQ